MDEINFKNFFGMLKKHALIIIVVTFVLVLGIILYDTKVKIPLYNTYTTIVLTKSADSQTASSTITQDDININQKLVSTYREIIKSKLVLSQVIDNLELDTDVVKLSKRVSVEAVQGTEILKISVNDSDPEKSAAVANNIAKVFGEEVSKIYQINNVSVIDEAQKTNKVANDTLTRDIIFALLTGIFSSAIVLFIACYFDDTIKLTDTLEEDLKSPIVGKIIINDIAKKKNTRIGELIVNKYPKSLVSEGIKTLRTNLQFSSVDNDLKSILITSSIPGEGKSFISANLAIAFCQTGKNVLIVDCDMRKGRQHKIFNVSNVRGLSNLLIDTSVKDYMSYLKKTEIKNLFVLTRGTVPPNPSELLNSSKNRQLIKILTSKFDIVIFDGVPCNGLPDSVIMSTLVDKTIIVSAENITPKSVLENTKKTLSNVNADLAGIVLNKISKKSNGYYVKYYSYYGTEK